MSLWDESRLAVNALEMCENGNLLVTHFDGKPDMWNTKPPLVIWIQASFMKVFGYNKLALRLPSALAGLATVFLVFLFCKKNLSNEKLGYFASLVLITIPGYISNHVTRTGDYDSILTFFTTLSIFLIFIFSSKIKTENNRILYFIAFIFSLVVLTKGINPLILRNYFELLFTPRIL